MKKKKTGNEELQAIMDALRKDDIFRNPALDNMHFGRVISTLTQHGVTYSVMQAGWERQTRVLLVIIDGNGHREFVFGPPGMVHQPTLWIFREQLYLAWNQAIETGWQICNSRLDRGKIKLVEEQVVFQSEGLCMPPSATACGGRGYIAFSALYQGLMQINIACLEDRKWRVERPFSSSGVDRQRPRLAATRKALLVAWDQYRDQRYEVVLASLTNRREARIEHRLGQVGQHWLKPGMTGNGQDQVYLGWVVQRPVLDKLGIVDHHCYAMVAAWHGGELTILEDLHNHQNHHIIGDFREGLLADEIYKGHVGLRLNPQLALDSAGTLFLFWERRRETRGSDVFGQLIGRQYIGGNRWTAPAVYSRDGYAYAVAENIVDRSLFVSYYYFEARNLDIFRWSRLALRDGVRLDSPGPARWRRWRYTRLMPQAKPDNRLILDGEEYRLVWADTHCHSNFSPDAEGEPDQLVRFARDQAGLDVVSIIDNDYYPHKALTEAEWRIHGELAEHFSKPGSFVWLPGYEFTYHRSDLEPDFNHHCVIYPRKGGKLLRRIDSESNTDQKMIAALTQAGGMVYPHHCNYRLIDQSLEWNVEVCSSWRVCLEETTCTVDKLREGARIGFIGSSDTHRMVPGLGGARTGLYVRELTPEALFEAYRKRRLFATQGFNIFIDFRVNGRFIGESAVTRLSRVPLRGRIIALEPIDYVEIIRDGVSIWWNHVESSNFSFEYVDEEPGVGPHFYWLKVKLHGDPSLNADTIPADNFPRPFEQNSRYPHNLARARGVFAWTSPVWLDLAGPS